MALTPHTRAAAACRGGVKAVSFVRAGAMLGVSHSGAGRVALSASEPPADYHFVEGTARYDARLLSGGLTEHVLSFRLDGLDAGCMHSLQQLLDEPDGIVAVVETADGFQTVAGWSARYGSQFPLRVADALLNSGMKPLDDNGATITLKCTY